MRLRLALADALIELRRYGEAVEVLEAGMKLNPNNKELNRKLTTAREYLEEQHWIQKRGPYPGDDATTKVDTATKVNVIRCRKLKGEKALSPCNAGLEKRPGDRSLLTYKGDALLELDRATEAISVYQLVLAGYPDSADVKRKLEEAQSSRPADVRQCMRSSGAVALKACDDALLPGAKDELAIRVRRGELLAVLAGSVEALDAYREAQLQRYAPRSRHSA